LPAAVSVDGWDFSWLDGRATEERPRGVRAADGERMARAHVALDTVPRLAPVTVATEGWPPNLAGPRHGCDRAA
jgi:hypothetical protein